MELGGQTHFSQGQNTGLLSLVKALGVTEIRDSIPWSVVETARGQYNIPSGYDSYMQAADNQGMSMILTFAGTNRLHDHNVTPYTPEGRQAFANYVVDVLDHYHGHVGAIEIGNEFNGNNFVSGPALTDHAKYYFELLKTVYTTVKAHHPGVEILGGAAHSVSTGYLAEIFARGGLKYMDGVALHPYRPSPEHVDDELRHLNEVMAKFGGVKPIYATEFGTTNTAEAPAYMLKMVTLMASEHVAEASWYQLQDDGWNSRMGLFDRAGHAKPAAAAMAFIQHELLAHGDPVQIDVGDDHTFIYRFGKDSYVMWGDPRPISFSGAPDIRDAQGHKIAAPDALSDKPIVVSGDFHYALGASKTIADSFLEFGDKSWDYFAKTADGQLHPLELVDWAWTSYIGGKFKPLQFHAGSLAPAGDGKYPIEAVERYTAHAKESIEITGHWAPSKTGDGIKLHILLNGEEIFGKTVKGSFDLSGLFVTLKPGDTLDFAVGPNQNGGGYATNYRVQLLDHDAPGGTIHSDVTFRLDRHMESLILTGNGNIKGYGNALDNHLEANAGRNVLKGGAGADTYVFASVAEAKSHGNGRDVVHFSPQDGDKIDFSRIDANKSLSGDQHFTLVSALAGHAGELATIQNHYGSVIAGDINGDGHADFSVFAVSHSTLHASDFFL